MIRHFFALAIIVLAGWALPGAAPLAQAQTKTSTYKIKFTGTNTCAYVDASNGRVRLKQAACSSSDTGLHFEFSGPPSSIRIRHIATNRCLKLVPNLAAPPAVVGAACSSADPGFTLQGVATGVKVIRGSVFPPPGLCCVQTYCLYVSGSSEALTVWADACPNNPPTSFRFKIENL